MSDGQKITLEIKNSKPVELTDLANCLYSLGDEYKRYISLSKPDGVEDIKELKLYVEEVRRGSILIDLAVIGYTMYSQTGFDSLLGYVDFLKQVFDYLAGKLAQEPNDLSKKTFENASNITEIITKDSSGTLNFVNHGNIVLNVNFADANTIQNQANKAIAKLEEPTKGQTEKVVMYLYQVRKEDICDTGDMGIIEKISDRPVKLFMEETLKKQILAEKDILHKNFIVDVDVSYKKGKPILYHITKLYEGFTDREAK